MPPVIGAVVIGLVEAGLTFGAAIAIGGAISSLGTALILGGISRALTPKPKQPGYSSQITGGTVAVRQSDLTRQYVYGHTRITRGYAHMESTGVNGTLHLIIILCQGTLRSINEVWADDYCIPPDWIDADGNVTQGRYAGYMTIRKHLGTPDQDADTNAIANMQHWTSAHKLSGVAYLYVTMTKNQDVYPSGVPNMSAVVEGLTTYDPRVAAPLWSTNIALYANDFLQNGTYGFTANSDDVDDTNVAAQANICDEIVDTMPDDSLVSSVAVGSEIITLEGALLKYQFGDRVEIVTDGTPPGGLSTGTAYYVIPYQIKDTPRIMLATSLANSMAKTPINLTSTGSGVITVRKTGEPRYHGAGIFDTETNISDTLNDIVNSMAGRAVCIGGFWTLLAGAWRTPGLGLGIEDMRASLGFKNSLSMSESYNIVKGLFVSSVNLYQASDYPAAQYQQFIDDDNGIPAIREINLPFTNRPNTAQRIAKIELFKGRQGIVATADFSMKALQVQPGDNVELDVARLGWSDKVFEITNFGLDSRNNALVTRLELRETAQEIYDWTTGEAIDYDPAPNTNLTNPFFVAAPTGVGYNSRSVGTTGGDTFFTVQLQWNLHPDAFVIQYGEFEIQFKLSTHVDWLPSFFVAGELTYTDVFTASAGVSYDVRIRAINNLGVRSAWTYLYGVMVGASGGVGTFLDWRFVYEVVSVNFNYESVTDPISIFNDWGYVV